MQGRIEWCIDSLENQRPDSMTQAELSLSIQRASLVCWTLQIQDAFRTAASHKEIAYNWSSVFLHGLTGFTQRKRMNHLLSNAQYTSLDGEGRRTMDEFYKYGQIHWKTDFGVEKYAEGIFIELLAIQVYPSVYVRQDEQLFNEVKGAFNTAIKELRKEELEFLRRVGDSYGRELSIQPWELFNLILMSSGEEIMTLEYSPAELRQKNMFRSIMVSSNSRMTHLHDLTHFQNRKNFGSNWRQTFQVHMGSTHFLLS
jgi:hypothetical protein